MGKHNQNPLWAVHPGGVAVLLELHTNGMSWNAGGQLHAWQVSLSWSMKVVRSGEAVAVI